MNTMGDLERKLQKADRKQASLYLFCNFISLMLVSAYSAMIFSPTVRKVFPEGGDSRKQVMAIFVLTLFGCIVSVIYAASLFFRKKSGQLGILMALGASRKRLAPGLFKEVIVLSGLSSLAGIAAGLPFVWLLWNCFRLFVVDSEEMKLLFDFKYLLVSFAFLFLVIAFGCMTAFRYLRKSDIMDVIQEEHKNEPVHEPGKWCGPLGIVLLLAGAVAGYQAPGIYMRIFQAYPPAILNIVYAPVFIGLYMIMLHTVVHGWGSRRKDPYKNLISRSMMKFQGKQTVNNLLVITVLIAGAVFAIFYIPMLGAGQILETRNRTFDYAFHYRADQKVPGQTEIEKMAVKYGIALKDWKNSGYITLALDGDGEVEDEGGAFHYEYFSLLQEGKFLSENAYHALTGQQVDVRPGTYCAVSDEEETEPYYLNANASKLTNMVTRDTIPTEFAGYVHCDMLVDMCGYYVLDQNDYSLIEKGLTDEWRGNIFWFNVDGADSYAFAKECFYTFVDSFGPECELPIYYDRVRKIALTEAGETYWGDTDQMTPVSYAYPDSADFRSNWAYMPKIRILDQNDFLRTFAVFLMMFLFISIVCILAALIICYTRCQTIALNNRYVFDDLKRLGAPPLFLAREVRSQCSIVFKVPAIVGCTAMYFLYALILYANDGTYTVSELAGLAICLVILVLTGAVIYLVYRRTVKAVSRQLQINTIK
ncbi:MAG: ABC transporter permease [Eubacteriales bacterium]|nr:ABC transporter permease [Eubacteriales bacterium]